MGLFVVGFEFRTFGMTQAVIVALCLGGKLVKLEQVMTHSNRGQFDKNAEMVTNEYSENGKKGNAIVKP